MSEKILPRSAEMSGGPGFRVRAEFERPSREVIDDLATHPTADISDTLNRMFTMSSDLQRMVGEGPLAGPAVTVKVFPGDNLMLHKSLDVVQEGDVIVVDTSGSHRNAVIGDMVAHKAKHRGAAGCVIDGMVRDLDGMRESGLKIFAKGVTAFGPLHRGPGEVNYPIVCGGIVVNPGDIIIGDDDGVVVVPRTHAEQTADSLSAQSERLSEYIENVKQGVFSTEWVDQQLNNSGCDIE